MRLLLIGVFVLFITLYVFCLLISPVDYLFSVNYAVQITNVDSVENLTECLT